TELMFGEAGGRGDGSKRPDMPGGWAGDERNVFTAEGRTETENEIFNYISAINKWRKDRVSIHDGKFKHFVPFDNVYVYFRYTAYETTMVVVNLQEQDVELDPVRFAEVLRNFTSGKVIIENRELDVTKPFTVKAKTTSVIEL